MNFQDKKQSAVTPGASKRKTERSFHCTFTFTRTTESPGGFAAGRQVVGGILTHHRSRPEGEQTPRAYRAVIKNKPDGRDKAVR